MDDDLPMDTSRDVFYFTEGALAYAGHYLHAVDNPLHTHSFVEIAFTIGGTGTHHCIAGRRALQPGDVVLLRPGVWHGYESCEQLELYNCCFSSELLRRELAWTREDPLLGYLLWSGPYSAPGRGVLSFNLDQPEFQACLAHLEALAALRHCPPGQFRGDILGRLSLLLSQLGRVAQASLDLNDEVGPAHPAVGRAIRMLESDIARRWTLTSLADELHLAPGYLVRLFKSVTGLPPMAYLAQVRAEHAAVLLLHSDEPITGIGRTVGWSDQNYFARRFKAHYGLSATTYRKRFATLAAHLHRPELP
ncbi:MAG TPA: AraC family transcriptional regulator [Streptosporangiaceae bacterium]|jgi:AraC family L-rhamnose operon transcriptional activator RhaR